MKEQLVLRNVMTGKVTEVEIELDEKPSAWQKPFDFIVWWYKRRVEYAKLGVSSLRMYYAESNGNELKIYEGIRDWSKRGMPVYQAVIFRRMARVLAFREKIHGVRT